MKSAHKATRNPTTHAPAPPEKKDLPPAAVPAPTPDGGDLPSIIRSAAAKRPVSPEPAPIVPDGKDQP
jgi:hypothetical protein